MYTGSYVLAKAGLLEGYRCSVHWENIARHYLQIRLQGARELSNQTSMSLVKIASLTGFVSSSHFSESYKEFYGYAPSAERR